MIGEDAKQIQARYGEEKRVIEQRGNYREVGYVFERFAVLVKFIGGKSQKEGFQKLDQSAFSPDEIKEILAKSVPKSVTWHEVSPQNGERIWNRSDGKATVTLVHPNFLVVQDRDYVAPEESELQSRLEDAQKKFSTPTGHDYVEKFATGPAAKCLIDAMHACDKPAFPSDLSHDVVFVIGADGKIDQVRQSSGNPYGDCIAAQLQTPKNVPKPPGDHWPVQIHLVNGPREANAPSKPYVTFALDEKEAPPAAHPPDKPVTSAGQAAFDARNKAMAPYIERGRATYPAAKKRFLAGLTSGQTFSVMKRLSEGNGAVVEDVFVYVDSIKDGKIYGRIASELQAIKSQHQWDKISFPESEIMDWTIVHADGSEEGNAVGKFLDTYKPQ